MARVMFDLSMSLDGFIAGPRHEIEPLHDWLVDESAVAGLAWLEEGLARTGAVIMGRRTFDLVDGPDGWTSPDGIGFSFPVFVLTAEVRGPVTKGVTPFTFVADGVESALTQARAVAGEKDVALMGANTAQQYVRAGLVDEFVLHLVPVLLGSGIRLFGDVGDGHVRLEQTDVAIDPRTTHLRYRVLR